MNQEFGDVDAVPSIKKEESLSEYPPQSNILLTDLPYEVFLHITSFLNAQSLITLTKVCKLYDNWLKNENFWRLRLVRRWPFQFPALSDETVDWKEACFQREEVHRRWSNWVQNFTKVEIRHDLSHCVDAVHLRPDMGLMFTGCRNRRISAYRTKEMHAEKASIPPPSAYEDFQTHKGWIWRIDSRENTLLSTAWDRRIRFWDIQESGLTLNREVTLSAAVLDGIFFDSTHCAVATTFDKTLFLLDTRQEDPVAAKLKAHQGVVLRVCRLSEPNMFVSGSEDGKLYLWDSRHCEKPVDGIRLVNQGFGYPRCLTHQMQSHLWVGDSRGLLHLVRVTGEGLSLENSYGISSVLQLVEVRSLGIGAIVTASQQELIRIWHPTRPPAEFMSLKANTSNQDLASMDVASNALVVGAGNGIVTCWTERQRNSEESDYSPS